MGIFGFLSKAHIQQTVEQGDSSGQIQLVQRKIDFEQNKINDAERVLEQLDKSVETLLDYDRIRGKDGALAIRQSQKEERKDLLNSIQESMELMMIYKLEIEDLQKERRSLEAEVGPLKYIAELIYGETANDYLENTVRVVIILIVTAFDPLAVMLLIAANVSLSREKMFSRPISKSFSIKAGDKDLRINI
jgi:cell division protein FtsB